MGLRAKIIASAIMEREGQVDNVHTYEAVDLNGRVLMLAVTDEGDDMPEVMRVSVVIEPGEFNSLTQGFKRS